MENGAWEYRGPGLGERTTAGDGAKTFGELGEEIRGGLLVEGIWSIF
jgi:hypothetical protein